MGSGIDEINGLPNVVLLPLHKCTKDIVEKTCDLLNTQWPRSRTARLHSLKQSRDSYPCHWICVTNTNQVISHVRLVREGKGFFIESLIVAPSHRGQNIGAKLLDKLQSKLNPTKWCLFCEDELESYYRKMNFTLEGKKVFPVLGNEERLYMVKQLINN
ncbi:hypothetical protein HDE_14565 [Halotydeus destructor]|nr:hypothetical protein HDE_14565 [Halotydeus destructor]